MTNIIDKRSVKIFFIYAENCKHCMSALKTIEVAIKKTKKIPCKIIKMLYNNDVALKIAIEHNIDELPGFVIGTKTFKGQDYNEERIISAIYQCAK